MKISEEPTEEGEKENDGGKQRLIEEEKESLVVGVEHPHSVFYLRSF